MRNTNRPKFLLINNIILLMGLILASPVSAQTSWSDVCVSETDPTVPTIQGVQCLVANVLSSAFVILGLVGFVMFVYGALKWMLSGGKSQDVEIASKTMLYAFAGLVLAVSAFMIINIIAEFTGVKAIKNFAIPNSSFDFTSQSTISP